MVTTQHCCYSTERVLDKCMNNDGYATVNFHLQKQAMDWIWPMDQLQSIAITTYLGGSFPLYSLIPFCLSFLSKFCKKNKITTKKTVLSRQISHTIQFIHLRCTVFFQYYETITTIRVQYILIPPKINPVVINSHFPPPPLHIYNK